MNIDLFFEAPLVIQAHAGAAMAALALGAGIYALPKGRRRHQVLGIATATLLVVVVVTAFFIRTGEGGAFSWIHFFIPLTAMGLFGAAMGVARKDWKRHKNAARGLVFGALMVPGLFTLLPGRLMHGVFLGG